MPKPKAHWNLRLQRWISRAFGSQAEAARKSGISEDTISHWCTGKNVPQDASLMQLADAGGISVETLSAWVFDGVETGGSGAVSTRGGSDRFQAILLLMPHVDSADDLRLIADRAGRLANEREQASKKPERGQ